MIDWTKFEPVTFRQYKRRKKKMRKKRMNKKHFHIKCLKPKELFKYGFAETDRSYVYNFQSKRWKVEVWKANARQRVENQMVFDFGMPPMTIEVLMLFANLLKDNVIELIVETDEEIKLRKIQKLEEELKQLKEKKYGE